MLPPLPSLTAPSAAAPRPPPVPTLADARRILLKAWGFPDFRYHQRRAVLAALRGRDCLAVLPTGGGKSLCYQVPAVALPGLSVVVSPLISLMQDQVAALKGRGIHAAYLISTQRKTVQDAVWEAALSGRLDLLYVAPERMPQLVDRLGRGRRGRGRRRGRISLLAVDEAHCISEWGHDFRPHYRSLGKHRCALGYPPTMAVTATATPATRRDIARILQLRRPVGITQSFDRPNLFFAVRRLQTEYERLRLLASHLRGLPGTAIVYVPTRERTDGVTSILRQCGIPAAPYHAALPGGARQALLGRFMDGQIRVMVATNAFGMGIDKADVRLVAHLGVPPRPEAYFQEAGRAGRDGAPARCELLWLERDLTLTRYLSGLSRTPASKGGPGDEARKQGLRAMWRYIKGHRCRRRVLLDYLGDQLENCSGCDRCSPES